MLKTAVVLPEHQQAERRRQQSDRQICFRVDDVGEEKEQGPGGAEGALMRQQDAAHDAQQRQSGGKKDGRVSRQDCPQLTRHTPGKETENDAGRELGEQRGKAGHVMPYRINCSASGNRDGGSGSSSGKRSRARSF